MPRAATIYLVGFVPKVFLSTLWRDNFIVTELGWEMKTSAQIIIIFLHLLQPFTWFMLVN